MARNCAWRLVDEDAPLRPRSLYAASKTAQEHYALAWSEATGGSVVALRYHNVYGPGMPRDTPYSGVAAIFRSALEKGEPPRVFEDGGSDARLRPRRRRGRGQSSRRRNAERDGLHRRQCLLGAARFRSWRWPPRCAMRAAAPLSPVVTGQYRSGDVRHIVADPARAAEVLGFRAAVDPRDGLREFAFAPLR